MYSKIKRLTRDRLTLSVLAHVYIREEKLCTGYQATFICY